MHPRSQAASSDLQAQRQACTCRCCSAGGLTWLRPCLEALLGRLEGDLEPCEIGTQESAHQQSRQKVLWPLEGANDVQVQHVLMTAPEQLWAAPLH